MNPFRLRRRGVTSVEFAMTVPILFMLLFAALEFMRANNLLHTADGAAYEGARRGITPGASVADVEATVNAVMAPVGAQNVTVTTDPAVITKETGEVTVTVSIPMNGNGFVAPLFFKDQSVSTSMTMVREMFSHTNVSGTSAPPATAGGVGDPALPPVVPPAVP